MKAQKSTDFAQDYTAWQGLVPSLSAALSTTWWLSTVVLLHGRACNTAQGNGNMPISVQLFFFFWLKLISQKYSEFQKCLPGRMTGELKLHVRGGLEPVSSERGEENSGIKECAPSGI